MENRINDSPKRRIRAERTHIHTFLKDDELIKLTAKITNSTEKEVRETIEFTFKELKYWMQNPYLAGAFWIPNFGTFYFNSQSCYNKILEYDRKILKYPEKKEFIPEQELIKKRWELAKIFKTKRKAKGKALNQYRKERDIAFHPEEEREQKVAQQLINKKNIQHAKAKNFLNNKINT